MTAHTIATNATGTTATGTAPRWEAKVRHTDAPTAIPEGTPITRPITTTVSACHHVAARTCRRTKPSTFEQRDLSAPPRDTHEQQVREGGRSEDGEGDAQQERKVDGLAEVDQVDRHVEFIDVAGELSLVTGERGVPGRARRNTNGHAPSLDGLHQGRMACRLINVARTRDVAARR